MSRSIAFGPDDAVEEFMGLVAAVLDERHGVPATHTPQEMRLLADRFPSQIRLFTARLDGELLAGALVYETPTVGHTQYIAASARGRELSASDALLTHLIADRYPDRWFDFGISNEPDGSLNEGLARYKEAFGARTIVYDRYELALSP
jgi:lipid II:glycine glycyltransferase (peptidoglycan interpeptide bridge formation enzyme)